MSKHCSSEVHSVSVRVYNRAVVRIGQLSIASSWNSPQYQLQLERQPPIVRPILVFSLYVPPLLATE